jgi:hypothetical protein
LLGRAGGSWEPLLIADLDGDGLDDLFWRDGTGANAVWPSGAIGQAVFLPGVGLSWRPIGAAQVFGDGRANLIWQHDDGVVAFWRMTSGWTPAATFATGVPAAWALLTR